MDPRRCTDASAFRRRPPAGFSLTELIIGSSLSVIVLAGVLSAFLMLGRSGMNAANYAMAEAEVRRAIEVFSQDVRMASNITWNSARSVTLTLVAPNPYSGLTPIATEANRVTYAYDSPTKVFYRLPGSPVSGANRLVLVREVSALTYYRYDRADNPLNDDGVNHDPATKRVLISMNVRRSGQTLVDTNTTMVMASYILRNKTVN
jgi:Tfp pilus assembly protein PilW